MPSPLMNPGLLTGQSMFKAKMSRLRPHTLILSHRVTCNIGILLSLSLIGNSCDKHVVELYVEILLNNAGQALIGVEYGYIAIIAPSAVHKKVR